VQVQRQYREDLTGRVRVLTVLVAVGLLIVGGGLWFVQLVQGSHYRELAENNRLRRMAIRAPRGLIYDHEGRLMVENAPSYDLLLDRSRTPDLAASLGYAARVLGRPVGELYKSLEATRGQPEYQPVPVARSLTLPQVARFSAAALEHPEFEIDVRHLRLYRNGPQVAHLIGYLGEVSKGDLERARAEVAGRADDDDGAGADGAEPRYRMGDLIGKKGIELTYDDMLRGRNGERAVVVDNRGNLIQEYGRVDSDPGEPLRLTLDLPLQQAAERVMRDKVGAVVALDPRDGAVRAMVSSPSYDPNLFARGIRAAEWRELLEHENDPLQNRAIQNQHSPGSVFKIVMATAGLSEGVITPSTSVHCSGGAVIYGRHFKCWKAGGHGTVSLNRAIAQSCNVYFYHLGRELGIERIAKWSRALGLGERSGIELDGEIPGLVPDPEWSLRTRKHQWFPGETISVSIGQGAISVTPIQIARAVAAIANGGTLVTPHLVEGAPAPTDRVPVDDRVLGLVRQGMASVMQPGGTAYWRSHIPGFDYAGKTGTVQVVGGRTGDSDDLPWKLRNHAWFASFGPVEDPRLVVVVLNEHGGSGSSGAAPIAKELYEEFFRVGDRAPDAARPGRPAGQVARASAPAPSPPPAAEAPAVPAGTE